MGCPFDYQSESMLKVSGSGGLAKWHQQAYPLTSKCSLNREVVDPRRSAEEHVVTLARRVRRGDLLQRVPQHAVRQ